MLVSHLARTNPTFQVEKEAGNFLENHLHLRKPARLQILAKRGLQGMQGLGGGREVQGDHEGTGGKPEQAQLVM